MISTGNHNNNNSAARWCCLGQHCESWKHIVQSRAMWRRQLSCTRCSRAADDSHLLEVWINITTHITTKEQNRGVVKQFSGFLDHNTIYNIAHIAVKTLLQLNCFRGRGLQNNIKRTCTTVRNRTLQLPETTIASFGPHVWKGILRQFGHFLLK